MELHGTIRPTTSPTTWQLRSTGFVTITSTIVTPTILAGITSTAPVILGTCLELMWQFLLYTPFQFHPILRGPGIESFSHHLIIDRLHLTGIRITRISIVPGMTTYENSCIVHLLRIYPRRQLLTLTLYTATLRST